MEFGFLKDSSGNSSSKRLWGTIILSVAVIFSAILFFYSIEKGVHDTATATAIIKMFFMAGGGLLGIGTLDHLSSAFGKKKSNDEGRKIE
jgi:hypothetical protein